MHMPTLFLLVLVPVGAHLGCGAQSLAPAGWDDGLKLAEPADINPDPKVVEVNLTARLAEVEIAPGKRVQAWTYDGGLPGPLIKTRVGDRLIVHFKNELKEPTTVHWHGVRVPIEMDGVPEHLAAGSEAGRDRSPTTSWCAMPASTGITRT